MTMQLTDDGTMDTVIRCSDCGEEFRFSYAEATETTTLEGEVEPTEPYDAFVEWAIEEAAEDHECGC